MRIYSHQSLFRLLIQSLVVFNDFLHEIEPILVQHGRQTTLTNLFTSYE